MEKNLKYQNEFKVPKRNQSTEQKEKYIIYTNT